MAHDQVLASTQGPDTDEDRVYGKVTRRLLPLLFISYLVAYLDRVNVGFAKLQMLNDLKFSETVYGLGAGIFFIGYFLFEVPSNLILHKVGARVWIARIMITWGLISAAMMFVTTPTMFYVMRFLLGVAEAGFFPGVILYLTYWYPAGRRARMTAIFMTAIAVSGVIGSPLSGWILQAFAGVNGWAGWQWLFLLEGIPSVLVGIAVLVWLDDGIARAKWLADDEKRLLQRNIAGEAAEKSHHSVKDAFSNWRVWVLALIYFCDVLALYAVSFWLPTIVKAAGVKGTLEIGLLTAIPYAVATVAMLLVSRSSDRHRERRWHLAIPLVIGAAGLIASTAVAGSVPLSILFLSIGTAGILTGFPLFWSSPTAFLGGTAAAAGIALINSIGNLAGFVSPYMVGAIKDATQSTDWAMVVLAAFLVLGAVLVLVFLPARLVNR